MNNLKVDMSVGCRVTLVNAPLSERVKYYLTRGRFGSLQQLNVIHQIPGVIHCLGIKGVIHYE